ncbi:photosystem II reaction center PSB28 protein, chloroplastic [Andrographis paniculata]|uniref:photosystem II reaction center PSB28 protein, chloroplastic n=1 Tax=Andrographis paniculata TaxID=175694 RepID=UPI0021E79663|nr:photosystem II reaction center PSB28 protein, chloroplastic [Andrographis paniculata]
MYNPLSLSLSLKYFLNLRMAALQYLAFPSPISRCCSYPRSVSGFSIGAINSSLGSSFNGQFLCLRQSNLLKQTRIRNTPRLSVVMMKPTIQFIQGTDEQTIPEVKLTKSRDGTNGMAIFSFTEPSVFDSSSVVGDITGFFMIDEEGTLQSVDVSAKYINGKPAGIEAKYVMRSPKEWDRFMRFMERYASANGLAFVKK